MQQRNITLHPALHAQSPKKHLNPASLCKIKLDKKIMAKKIFILKSCLGVLVRQNLMFSTCLTALE